MAIPSFHSEKTPSFSSTTESTQISGDITGRKITPYSQEERIKKIDDIFAYSKTLDNSGLDQQTLINNKISLINESLNTSFEYTISHFAKFKLSTKDYSSFVSYCKYFATNFPGLFLQNIEQFKMRFEFEDDPGNEILMDAIWQMSRGADLSEIQDYLEDKGLNEIFEKYSHNEELLRNILYICVLNDKLGTTIRQVAPDFRERIMQALSSLQSDASKKFMNQVFLNFHPCYLNPEGFSLSEKWLPVILKRLDVREVPKFLKVITSYEYAPSTPELAELVSHYIDNLTKIFLDINPDAFIKVLPSASQKSLYLLIEGKSREEFVKNLARAHPETFCKHWNSYHAYCGDSADNFYAEVITILAEKAPHAFLENFYYLTARLDKEEIDKLFLNLAQSHPYEALKTLFDLNEIVRDRLIRLLDESRFWENEQNIAAIFKEEDGLKLFFQFFKSNELQSRTSPEQVQQLLISISKNLLKKYEGKPGAGALTALEKNQLRHILSKRQNFEILLSNDSKHEQESQSLMRRLGTGYRNLFLCNEIYSNTTSKNMKEEENYFLKHGIEGYNNWKAFSPDAFALFDFVYRGSEEVKVKDLINPDLLKNPTDKFAFGCLFPLLPNKDEKDADKLTTFLRALEHNNSREPIRNLIRLMWYLKTHHGFEKEELSKLMDLFLNDPQNALKLTDQFNAAFRIIEFQHSSAELREMILREDKLQNLIDFGFSRFSQIFDLDDSEDTRQRVSEVIFTKWRSPGLLIEYLKQRDDQQKVLFKRWVKSILGKGEQGEETVTELRYGGKEGFRNENWEHFKYLSEENRNIWKENQTKKTSDLKFFPKSIQTEKANELKKLNIKFTDDPESLFMIGEDSQSCQSISGGSHANFGLLATCFSGKNKLCSTTIEGEEIFCHRNRPSLVFKTKNEKGELSDPVIAITVGSDYVGRHTSTNQSEVNLGRIAEFALLLEIADKMGTSVHVDFLEKEIENFKDEDLVEVKPYTGKHYKASGLPVEHFTEVFGHLEITPKRRK